MPFLSQMVRPFCSLNFLVKMTNSSLFIIWANPVLIAPYGPMGTTDLPIIWKTALHLWWSHRTARRSRKNSPGPGVGDSGWLATRAPRSVMILGFCQTRAVTCRGSPHLRGTLKVRFPSGPALSLDPAIVSVPCGTLWICCQQGITAGLPATATISPQDCDRPGHPSS